MRTGAGFNAPAIPTSPVTAVVSGAHSAWHSPVPYLFGGLAAMLGLIAFALLILACSYWKLSGYLEGDGYGADADVDVESGGAKPDCSKAKPAACYEERIVVIMAGDEKPTFLATPISSRASSFGERSSDGKSNNGDGQVVGKRTESGGEGNGGDMAGTQSLTRNEDQNNQSREQ